MFGVLAIVEILNYRGLPIPDTDQYLDWTAAVLTTFYLDWHLFVMVCWIFEPFVNWLLFQLIRNKTSKLYLCHSIKVHRPRSTKTYLFLYWWLQKSLIHSLIQGQGQGPGIYIWNTFWKSRKLKKEISWGATLSLTFPHFPTHLQNAWELWFLWYVVFCICSMLWCFHKASMALIMKSGGEYPIPNTKIGLLLQLLLQCQINFSILFYMNQSLNCCSCTLHYWLRRLLGFWQVQKVGQSRHSFLINSTHKTRIFALCETVITQILCQT